MAEPHDQPISSTRPRTPREISNANLKPFGPGNNANPTGRNQYTVARERFEQYIAQFLDEESPKHKGMTRGQKLALFTLEDALNGEGLSRKESLKRLWPIIDKKELDIRGQVESRAVEENFSLDNLTTEERKTVKRLMMKAIIKPIDKEGTDGD